MAIRPIPYMVTTRLMASITAIIPLYVVCLGVSYLSTQIIVSVISGGSMGGYMHYFGLMPNGTEIFYSVLRVIFVGISSVLQSYYGFYASGGLRAWSGRRSRHAGLHHRGGDRQHAAHHGDVQPPPAQGSVADGQDLRPQRARTEQPPVDAGRHQHDRCLGSCGRAASGQSRPAGSRATPKSRPIWRTWATVCRAGPMSATTACWSVRSTMWCPAPLASRTWSTSTSTSSTRRRSRTRSLRGSFPATSSPCPVSSWSTTATPPPSNPVTTSKRTPHCRPCCSRPPSASCATSSTPPDAAREDNTLGVLASPGRHSQDRRPRLLFGRRRATRPDRHSNSTTSWPPTPPAPRC